MKSQTLVDKYHWSPINAERSSIKDSFLVDFVPAAIVQGSRYYINSKYVVIQTLGGFFTYDTEFNLIERSFEEGKGIAFIGLHDILGYYCNFKENVEVTYQYNLSSGIKTQLKNSLRGGLFIEDGVIVVSRGKISKIGYNDTIIWEVELPNTADFAQGLCYENSLLYYLTDDGNIRNCISTHDGSIVFSFQMSRLDDKFVALTCTTINFVVNDLLIGWYFSPNTSYLSNALGDYIYLFGYDFKINIIRWELKIPYFSSFSIYADSNYYSIYMDLETLNYYFMVVDLSNGLIVKQECIHDQIVEIQKRYETDESFLNTIIISGSCVSDDYFYFGIGTVYVAMHKENLSITRIFNNSDNVSYYKARIINGVILVESGFRLNILKEIPKVE